MVGVLTNHKQKTTPVCDHPSRGEFSPLLVFKQSGTNNIYVMIGW